jgi:hypothetical protein
MQWNLVTNSSNPADYPKPGEQVLGLWLGGFWKKVIYSSDDGWYTSLDGIMQSAPTWWARVDTAVAKRLPPQGEAEAIGPDATVMERVRRFLEQLIEVRDLYSADLELKLPPEYCGKYECYDDWAADGAAALLQVISLADNAEAARDLQICTERISQFKRENVTKTDFVERLRAVTDETERVSDVPAKTQLFPGTTVVILNACRY